MYPHEYIRPGGQRAFAIKARLTPETVNRVVKGRRWPSARVAKAFYKASGGKVDRFRIPGVKPGAEKRK